MDRTTYSVICIKHAFIAYFENKNDIDGCVQSKSNGTITDLPMVKMGAVGAIGCLCTLNDIGKPMVRNSTIVPLAHY
jgi:hypothetical protein